MGIPSLRDIELANARLIVENLLYFLLFDWLLFIDDKSHLWL